MSIPQRPTRKQTPSGPQRKAPPPPPTPGSPPPPPHSFSPPPPPPPLLSPKAPSSVASPVFIPSRPVSLQRAESGASHHPPPPLPSSDYTPPPPPMPARPSPSAPLPSRPLSSPALPSSPPLPVSRTNNSPPIVYNMNNVNFSKQRGSLFEKESSGEKHNDIFNSINRSPHHQSNTPTANTPTANTPTANTPTANTPTATIITTSLSPSPSPSSSNAAATTSTFQSSSSSTLPIPSSQEADSNREIKNTIDMISLNSWQNEAWTRSLANRSQHIAPPTRKTTEEENGGSSSSSSSSSGGEGGGCVDICDVIERMALNAWCNFCAQNLYFHSASLNSQEWLDNTCSCLAHLLEIFLLMNTDDLRCRCSFILGGTKGEENGGGQGSGSDNSSKGKYQSLGSPLLDKALMKPSCWKIMDGNAPTTAIVEEAHDCLLLFLHAFLAEEGPVSLLFLITDLLQFEKTQAANMSDTQAMHKVVESSLECIVKIFWLLQRVCARQTCTVKGATIRVGACDGVRVCKLRISPAAWTNREKLMWWMDGGVEEALLCMAAWGVPERVGITLMELLLDHITPIQDQSYTPFHIKKICDLSILPLLTTVCLLSKFDYLENILKYFTFLVVQKPENALVLVSMKKEDVFMFIMPSLLTGGTSCPQNKLLRIQEPRLAEEKVSNILRNTIGLIMSIFHIYFTSVDTTLSTDTSSSSSSNATTPSNATTSTTSTTANTPTTNNALSTSDNSSTTNNNNNTTTNVTFCALLFMMLDSLEDTAHKWEGDTIARANVIFYSLLIKITRNAKVIKRDIKSFMWESLFQLCFAIEDHVWYSASSPVPRVSPRHFRTFELRGTPANVALIAQLDELLATLEPAVQDDDHIQRTPVEKKRVDLLRARLAEERDFWSLSSDLMNIANNMDSATLVQDKRYKLVEISSRQRCSHYGDPTLSSKILPPLHVLRSPRSPITMSRTLDSSHRGSRILQKDERKHHTLGASLSSSASSNTPKKSTVDLSKLSRFVVKHIKEISDGSGISSSSTSTTTTNSNGVNKKTATKEDMLAFGNTRPQRGEGSAEDNNQVDTNTVRNRQIRTGSNSTLEETNRQKRAGSGEENTNNNNNNTRPRRAGSGTREAEENNRQKRTGSGSTIDARTRDTSPLKSPPNVYQNLLTNHNNNNNTYLNSSNNNKCGGGGGDEDEASDLPGPPPGVPPPSCLDEETGGGGVVKSFDILHLSLDPSNPQDLITVTDNYLDPELNPKYWKQHFDPEGNPMYFNTITKTLSTDKPPCLQDREAPVDSGIWEEFKDPNGEMFFFNSLISQATYDDPFLPRTSKSNTPRSSPRSSPRFTSRSPSFPSSSLSPHPPSLASPHPPKLPTSAPPPVSPRLPIAKQLSSSPPTLIDENNNFLLLPPPPPSKEVLEWREAFDASSGGHYFYNKLTNETRSECPECLKPFNLPQYWEETFDENSGRAFYFNTLTKLSTFVRPLCMDKVPGADFAPGSLEGWREATDQAVFWYNKLTGESTFERPRFMSKVDLAWQPIIDQASGKTYWFNGLTLQSTWKQPKIL